MDSYACWTCTIKQRAFESLLALLFVIQHASAAIPKDFAVLVGASASTTPAGIRFDWNSDAMVTNMGYFKKVSSVSWGSKVQLNPSATSFIDTNTVKGGIYEYSFVKRSPLGTGIGYIAAGLEVPLVEDRGRVILLVDSSIAGELQSEIERLRLDLIGDGWAVVRCDVPRNASCQEVKATLLATWAQDPDRTSTVFILGHVPVPYSGDFAPDAHLDHQGAWPADVFYADLDGVWTDTSATATGASSPRNRNTPGDGKFDQSGLPSDVELQLGRVDFANLPAFSLPETDLLKRYLDKDHRFRRAAFRVSSEALIDDNLGVIAGEQLAISGWRNFPPLCTASGVSQGDWLPTLANQSFLWGCGVGAGTFTSAGGVASTSQLAASDPRVVFTLLCGSYFGDWDSEDNFLRASIATPTFTLASAWSGRPNWVFQHMALGQTLGFCAKLTQNNSYMYDPNCCARQVHVALMGDPTLRMHYIAPVSDVTVVPNEFGAAILSWTASADQVLGYHVYRSQNSDGPFTRVNANLISETSFTDAFSNPCVYMVRAVKLEVTPSGSYYNASTGVFVDFVGGGGQKPTLTISVQATNKVYGAPVPTLVPVFAGLVDGDTPSVLSVPPVLACDATQWSPVGSYDLSASGAASSKYNLAYEPSTLSVLPSLVSGTLSASASEVIPGQPVTLHFDISAVPPGAGLPTGQVLFRASPSGLVGEGTLVNGTAICDFPNLPHGFNAMTAEYPGDGNFLGVTNVLAKAVLVNTPPLPGPDRIERSAWEGAKVMIQAMLQNDSDADGDHLNFYGVDPVSSKGALVTVREGWVLYEPPLGLAEPDSFAYYVSDSLGGPVSCWVSVSIREEPGSPPNLEITEGGQGTVLVLGSGVPGYTYQIQCTTNVGSHDWATIGLVTADFLGNFRFSDTNVTEQRFYRSRWP